MKQDTTQILTKAQKQERDFLRDLSQVLAGCDLSGLDLKTLPGTHNAHSALFENYELNITRTPVFVPANNLTRIFGGGDWKFQPGVFERYEIYIMENIKNMRAHDIFRYIDKNLYKTHNNIMQTATMATDMGYFAPTKRDLTGGAPDDLFYNQNAHLFEFAKQIYDVLDREYMRRNASLRSYLLSDARSQSELQLARMRMLAKVQQKQK